MRAVIGALLAAGLLSACGGGSPTVDASVEPPDLTPPAAATGTPPSTQPTPPSTPPATPPATPPLVPATSPPPSGTPAPSTATETITIPVLPTPLDRGPVVGADASWPQCPKGMGIPQKRSQGAPMPLESARFVVLGLTNGPGFHPNPCLADQVAWVQQRHLLAGAYSVLSYPRKQDLETYGDVGPYDPATALGRLANVGYQQALDNLRTMAAAGLVTPAVWIDVEPVSGFEWSEDTRANAAVVSGAAKGYADQGLTVGAYSTISLWGRVVGDLRLGLPEWRAAGETSRAEALRRCGPEQMFQGGTAVLTQWVQTGRDRDVTCPGGSTYLSLWFHQY